MAETVFSNFSDLAKDVKNNSFDGFSLKADDPRDLASKLENGSFENINLYNTGFEANSGLGDQLSNFLEGKNIAVYAQGKKLATSTVENTDLRVGGSSEKISFSNNLKDLSNREFPVDSGTIEDLFQATDVKELNFKPIDSEKVKDKAEKVAENENVELFRKLVKPLSAVATVIGLILTVRRLN